MNPSSSVEFLYMAANRRIRSCGDNKSVLEFRIRLPSFSEEFTPGPAGFRFYHRHNRAGADLCAGQYSGQVGPVCTEPKHEPGSYDREVFLVLKESEPSFSQGGDMARDFLTPTTRVKEFYHGFFRNEPALAMEQQSAWAVVRGGVDGVVDSPGALVFQVEAVVLRGHIRVIVNLQDFIPCLFRLGAALTFYTKYFGFVVESEALPAFAALPCGPPRFAAQWAREFRTTARAGRETIGGPKGHILVRFLHPTQLPVSGLNPMLSKQYVNCTG